MFTKLIFYSPSHTIDTKNGTNGTELLKNPTYSQCVNAENDLQFGQVASAQVTFETRYTGITKNTSFDFYTWQECDNSWRLIGKFFVNDIQKNEYNYTITAYDNICKLDVDCSNYLKTSSATTIWTLYSGIISWLRLTNGNSSSFIVNGDMDVTPSKLATAGVTARTIMHYIAEAVGAFIVAKPDGSIYLDIFGAPNGVIKNVTSSDYSDLIIADQPAPKPTSINV